MHAYVQVIGEDAGTAGHVQFVPLAPAYVRPAGNVSVMVIAPVVGTEPTLPATIVNAPVVPTAKSPVCDFCSVSVGGTAGGTIVVGSVAVAVFEAPAPVALTALTTVDAAVGVTAIERFGR